MLKSFKRFIAKDPDNTKVQTNVDECISAVLKKEILNGILLENISLVNGLNQVTHKLGRTPRGYMIVKQSAAIVINSSTFGDLFISLNITLVPSTVQVSLWIF